MEKNDETYPMFVYFSKEPPGQDTDAVFKANGRFSNLFNITYTYRKDSVIPFTYGKLLPRTGIEDLNSALQDNSVIHWKTVPDKPSKSTLEWDLRYKTKDILWMVSHCTTESKREDYVKKLQGHLTTLSVDIMGKCGNDNLPKSNIDGRRLGKLLFTKQ